MTMRTTAKRIALAAAAIAAFAGSASAEAAAQSSTNGNASAGAAAEAGAAAAADTAAGLAVGLFVPVAAGGFDDDLSDCGQPGDSMQTTLSPIVVANTYTTPQTFSITINPRLAGDANFISTEDLGTGQYDGCSINHDLDGTFDVTVAPGSPTLVGYLLAGAGETSTNNEGQDNNLSIGAGGEQWYDFWLHINSLDFSFGNFELNYSRTGGTNPTSNVQTGLFNGLSCSADGTTVTIDSPAVLTTPYTNNNANAWTFGYDVPICFGFLQPNSLS